MIWSILYRNHFNVCISFYIHFVCCIYKFTTQWMYILLHGGGDENVFVMSSANSFLGILSSTNTDWEAAAWQKDSNCIESVICAYITISALQTLTQIYILSLLLSKSEGTRAYCLIFSQNKEESWLVEENVWEISQLGWLAGGDHTDWMCTAPNLTHRVVKDHLVLSYFVCHSHHLTQ